MELSYIVAMTTLAEIGYKPDRRDLGTAFVTLNKACADLASLGETRLKELKSLQKLRTRLFKAWDSFTD